MNYCLMDSKLGLHHSPATGLTISQLRMFALPWDPKPTMTKSLVTDLVIREWS